MVGGEFANLQIAMNRQNTIFIFIANSPLTICVYNM